MRNLLLAGAALGAVAGQPAVAQSAPDPAVRPAIEPASPDANGPQVTASPSQSSSAAANVDDIVVTAQRRAENIQRVPIAITAVSGDALVRSGVTGTDALQRLAPGLTVASIGSGFVSYTYIRGGGTNQVDIGADPSVAYFVDEVYIGGTAGLQFDLFDIDHVEVLKGPQGTLFGRNAASGAISIVTKRPSATFEGYASVEAGDYGTVLARAGATGPLSDNLLFRTSVSYKRHDPYTDNLTGGADPGKLDSLGGRVQLEARGSNVTFLLTGDALRGRNGQTNQFFSTDNKLGLITAAAAAAYPMPGESFYRHGYLHDGFENQELYAVSGRLEVTTPFGSLTSISAYRDNHFGRSQDYTPGVLGLQLNTDERDRTFSQEIRLASNTGQRLEWLGGIFFYHADQRLTYTQVGGPVFASPVLQNNSRTDQSHLLTNSFAGFGQLTLHIVDRLRLIGGLRYTIDDKDDARVLYSTVPGPAFNFAIRQKDSWNAFTPAATLQFDLTSDVMAYGSYRRGFKSGGFQPAPLSNNPAAQTPFNPEKVNSYEIGVKSSFFDRRLTFDIDGFISDIKDQQISQTLLGASIINIVSNAGATTAKGVEVSLKARPVPALRLGIDATYQRAKFDRYSTLVGTTVVDYAGNTQLRSPDFTGALTADYQFDLGGRGSLTIGGDYSYRTKQFFSPANLASPGLYQPGYGLGNAHITYTPRRGNFDLTAFVRNMGDEKYYRNIIVVGATGLAQPGDPLTFGGSFIVRFR